MTRITLGGAVLRGAVSTALTGIADVDIGAGLSRRST